MARSGSPLSAAMVEFVAFVIGFIIGWFLTKSFLKLIGIN